MKGREEGVAKSIPQVNLRLEIVYTINKQGESGDGMRERRRRRAGAVVGHKVKLFRGHLQACTLRSHSAVLDCVAQLVATGMRRGL